MGVWFIPGHWVPVKDPNGGVAKRQGGRLQISDRRFESCPRLSMSTDNKKACLPVLDRTVDVVCPRCGCNQLVELVKVLRTIPFEKIDVYRARKGVLCEKNEDATCWDDDDIDYSTGDTIGYSCPGCDAEWRDLKSFVNEMESVKHSN